ncbi:MAG: DUF2294 domain-containing protein [Gemmataceae bacterium]
MDRSPTTMAQEIAKAASDFEHKITGHSPKSVTVVLSDTTLVITLHGSLSPAEQVLAQSAEGAAQVQDFHRRLFATASDSLRKEIKRITGVEVREATAEVEPVTGTLVKVFTTGTMVQVFLLGGSLPAASWSGNVATDRQATKESDHDGFVEKRPPLRGGGKF